MRPRPAEPATANTLTWRRAAGVVTPLAIAVVLTVVTLSSLTTARGRIAASTGTDGLLSAGEIDLIVESGSDSAIKQLFFDEDGLYAGQVLERCLTVRYEGSFDSAAIRFHARRTSGSGLSRYLELTIERGTGTNPTCTDFSPTSSMYTGRLDQLLSQHSTFESGLPVREPASAGESTTVRVRIELVDDNAAQALTTQFVASFEVRP